MMYIPAWESYASVFDAQPQEYEPGRSFIGGRPTTAEPVPDAPTVPGLTRGPINTWTTAAGSGAVVALDALTGEPRWKFEMTDVTSSGILTTASDLLFTGARSGYFQALDARTGDLLWRVSPGRPDRQRPDDLRGGRQAVRRGYRRKLPVHVRVARLERHRPQPPAAAIAVRAPVGELRDVTASSGDGNSSGRQTAGSHGGNHVIS